MKIVAASILVLTVSACGDGPLKTEKKESSGSSNYSYQYNENGCDTGKRAFSSKESYCDGLLDESANNYCARGMRQETYDRNCR